MRKLPNLSFLKHIEKNQIYGSQSMQEEIDNILGKSGYFDVFNNKFNQRVRFLNERKENCYLKSDWFERLKGDKKNRLYSMKFKDKMNPRILFIFTITDKQPILLHLFQEKSKNDYKDAIIIANKRIDELVQHGILKEENILCHTK